jgi:hypothetical protein
MPNASKSVVKKISSVQPTSELKQAIKKAGLDDNTVAKMLFELCNWTTIKIDKNGQVHENIDGSLRLKAIELWNKIMNTNTGPKTVNNNLYLLEKLSDNELNELEAEANKSRKNKKSR